MILELCAKNEHNGQRLDDALAALAEISKGEARRIIDRGGCALNRKMVRVASRSIITGDRLTVGIMEPGRFKELYLPPEAIICQDKHLLALNKPAGIPSQRTPYQLKGTLEYWVSEEFARQGIKEPVRVVHRLDRGTSGLMLFPKHRQEAAWLSEQFRLGRIEKRYLALVSGVPTIESWQVDGAIGKIGSGRWGVHPQGRAAITDFRLIETVGNLSLIEALPRTGRTHQIRVHLAACGLPIVGDQTYGGVAAQRMMLHCNRLALTRQNGELLQLEAKAGDDFTLQCRGFMVRSAACHTVAINQSNSIYR